MNKSEALKLFDLVEPYTDKDLRKSYLKLSKKFHPDVNGSCDAEEIMKKINEAKDILSDFSKDNVTRPTNVKDFHEELVIELKSILFGVNKSDVYYDRIYQVISRFENINLSNKNSNDINREYEKTKNEILDIYHEIKSFFFLKHGISQNFSDESNLFVSLKGFYHHLNKIKDSFEFDVVRQIVKNEIYEKFGNERFYLYLKDKIDEICLNELKEEFDITNVKEKVNVISSKVRILFIKYNDALQVINIINLILESIDNEKVKQAINLKIKNFNYIDNHAKLYELLIELALQKNIDAKQYSLLKLYVFEKYSCNIELLQRMLKDVDLVFNGFLDTQIYNIILKKNYTSLEKYDETINKYLNNKSIVFVKKKLVIGDICNIGIITDIRNGVVILQNDKYTWSVEYKYLLSNFETLDSFLRNNDFIGELVNNDKEILLYSNGVTALYLVLHDDQLVFRHFDRQRGDKIDYPDINKYGERVFVRNVVCQSLENKIDDKIKRKRKKYGL